jgi:hypothetical protein
LRTDGAATSGLPRLETTLTITLICASKSY